MLFLKKKNERARGAVVEQARTTVRGQHGFGGGAWGQLAQPRTWLRERLARLRARRSASTSRAGRRSPLTISRSLNPARLHRPQRWFLG